MSYFTYPEPARLPRPKRPTWQSLMARPGTRFQALIEALEVSGHATDFRDSRLLKKSADMVTLVSDQAILEKRMPRAFWSVLKSRNERINEAIDAWEQSL